ARLAVPDIDDPAVVEVPAAGAVALDDIVVAIERGELEILAGVEQAAIVLPEPLAVGPEIRAVAVRPESLQIGHPLRAGGAVELAHHAVRADGGEVDPVPGHGGGVVRGRAVIVGHHAVESSEEKQRTGDLELGQAPARAAVEVTAESGERGIPVTHLA